MLSRLLSLIAACAVFLIVPVASADDFQPDPGFLSLFNGRDLTGWHYKGGPAFDGQAASSDGRYSAKDGVLTVNFPQNVPRKVQQMWTLQEFPRDFILKLEFRASVNADSGIFLREPQLQCRDYLVAGPYKDLKQYKAQDWNTIEVIVKANSAYCTCNGEVLETAFKLPATGPIGLEGDRGQMEYRHIQIKELP